MKKQRAAPRKSHPEAFLQLGWDKLDVNKQELGYNYGNSIVTEIVLSHDHAAVLRELVQNEYDAGGSRLQVSFGLDELRISGEGNPIDAAGWKRLSVMMGAGEVGGSGRIIAQKMSGIGFKNFGLRSLFLYGDQIHIRSGGFQTVLDLSCGTLQDPKPEPHSKSLRGIEIVVPYRTRKRKGFDLFDVEHEHQALESFATDLTPLLMKLAQPKAPKSLCQLEISSVRCNRSLVLKQTVKVKSRQKGITAVRRAIHLADSKPSDSHATGHTIEEIEFQRIIPILQQYRSEAIPGYYNVPGGRIRLAVSMRMSRKKIDIEHPGHFFYPLGATMAYTGNAISINAPFQMNADRSQIIDPSNNEFNGWLIDRATDLTLDLLISSLWNEFGPDAYLALQEQTLSAIMYFRNKVTNRLENDACWPTRVREKGSLKRPQLASATKIVVPTYPVLDGFLSDACYLDDTLGNDPRIQTMVKKFGAKAFGISSLVRLWCAGSDKTQLATKLASGETDWTYTSFPDILKEESLQRKFAQALDALASHLSKQNREDLKKSPTMLAADGSLQAPEKLWVVDPAIASVCPIPPLERLHPLLTEYKTLVKLCNKDDAKKWIQKTVQQVQDGTASEEQRIALYNFILASRGQHLDRKTWAMLRKTPVLRDHRNEWVMPKAIILRKAVGAPQLEAALHFPHPDYENDKELAEALRFKKKVTGEDIVRYAHIVETQPDLAPEFEETLQKFSRILTKQEFEKLKTVAFLQSSQGKLASPATLYLRTPHTLACLGDDAKFITGSRTALYKRLGCMEQPKADDILTYLTKLRSQGIRLKQPEILYPTLVEALKARKNTFIIYQNQPIIWDGRGYSKPADMLLSRKYHSIFLQSIPQLEEASPTLRQALKSLGVSSDPQPQHWQKLFVWFDQRYTRLGEPLTRLERHALHQAYSLLYEMPKGVTEHTKCLLDQDGRLHSQAEMRAKQYLLNDDPALAQSLMANGTSLAYADVSGPQQAKVLRFYRSIGISSLTEVREQIGCRIGAEKMPPPWCDSVSVIKKLHDSSFLSALTSLANYQLQEYSDLPISPIPKLQAARSLVFAQPLHIEYRVGSVTIPVPTDVVLDHERFVLAEAQSHNELFELLSQEIANLFVKIPAEQHRFANAVFRILTCSSPNEMKNYLRRQGIQWEPPSSKSEAEVAHLEDEFSDFVTDTQIEPELTPTTLNDEANRDYQVVEEVIKSSIVNRLSTSYTTSNTTFNLGLKEEGSLNTISSKGITLPPIESVTPTLLEMSDSWSPKDSNSNGAGQKRSWTPSTSVDEERDRQVGQRGEEIIFLQELERVTRLGYPKSRVVWIAKENPLADYDILSVDENGRDLWIEVKSTTGRHGHFQWSIAELIKAIQKREQYILWRVYETGTIHPSIKPFRDPVSMIIRHSLRLEIASLSAEVEPLRVPD